MSLFNIFRNKENKYLCSTCGKAHDELPALGFITPYFYDILKDEDKRSIAEFSDDFCMITHPEQIDYFIRTVLTIPINDICEDLDYGVWVSVSNKTFDEYSEGFKTDVPPATYFGMIANEIKDYKESTLGIHANVNTRTGGIRPEIIPHQGDHQLIQDFQNGITLKEAEQRIKKAMDNK